MFNMAKRKIPNGDSNATKNDVYNIVIEATDAILTGVERLLDEKLATKADKTDVKKLENRMERVEADISFIKDDIKGLRADLAVYPQRGAQQKIQSP